MSNTAGPILSNAVSPLDTSSAAWSTLWTIVAAICKTIQIINDGSGTGAARVSLGDRLNPLYIPAGGSLTLQNVMITGPVEVMRDAAVDLVDLKIQLIKEGAEQFTYT